MSTVLQFGRRRRGLPRYAGLALLGIMLCGLALFQGWQSGAVVQPQAVPSMALAAVRAVDGDTLSASQQGKTQRIRLSGIDAPELSQTCRDGEGRSWSCGTAARNHLSALVGRGNIICTGRGEDRYGRTLATCAANGVADIGEAMVRAGYALNYSRYTSDYAGAERDAKGARRGVWQGEFDSPEDWRRHARAQ